MDSSNQEGSVLPRQMTRIAASETLADKMTAVLKQRIAAGEYPSGSRLPTEQAMAEGFGVSRTVIREAVSRLRADGLVAVRQGRGTEVLPPQEATAFRLDLTGDAPAEDYVDIVIRVTELRRGIEVEGAALAAQRRTPQQVSDINDALNAIDQASAEGRDGVEEDLAFHHAIAVATGNSLYPSLLNFLNEFLRVSIRVTRSNEARRPDFSDQVRREHAGIAEAIAAGDPDAARHAVLLHMDNVEARIRAADPAFWAAARAKTAKTSR